ncbi:MAG: 4-hydroxy-tetrahydrodipicolinate reductase [Robiginitomaculum sp.]|nr:MAG: 4-hydroxy-tetrahydrodipicolinate reductase [Robiginitomaculum sp.]
MSANPLRIILGGPGGRLGSEISKIIADQIDLLLTAGMGRNDQFSSTTPDFDLMLDVSTCDGVVAHLAECVRLNKPIIIGVTGFSDQQNQQIKAAAMTIPVLQTGNFSIGINQLLQQVKQTAKALGPTWTVQIKDIHHTGKRDYPSGTALMLAQAIMDGVGKEMPVETVLYPEKSNSDAAQTISIISVRKGDEIGRHEVLFTNTSEKVVLGHTALRRSVFAEGGLVAARWLAGKAPGLYRMSDVLGR